MIEGSVGGGAPTRGRHPVRRVSHQPGHATLRRVGRARLVVADRWHLDPDPDRLASWRLAVDPEALARRARPWPVRARRRSASRLPVRTHRRRSRIHGAAGSTPLPMSGGRSGATADRLARRDDGRTRWTDGTSLSSRGMARDVAALGSRRRRSSSSGTRRPIRDLDLAMATARRSHASWPIGGPAGSTGSCRRRSASRSPDRGPTVALLGDLSFLHDAGAMLWNAHACLRAHDRRREQRRWSGVLAPAPTRPSRASRAVRHAARGRRRWPVRGRRRRPRAGRAVVRPVARARPGGRRRRPPRGGGRRGRGARTPTAPRDARRGRRRRWRDRECTAAHRSTSPTTDDIPELARLRWQLYVGAGRRAGRVSGRVSRAVRELRAIRRSRPTTWRSWVARDGDRLVAADVAAHRAARTGPRRSAPARSAT